MAKRKKQQHRRPAKRGSSAIRKKQTQRDKLHAKRTNRKPTKKHVSVKRPVKPVRKQRRSPSARKPHKRVVQRTPKRKAAVKKAAPRKVARKAARGKQRTTPNQRLRRDLAKTRDDLRRTKESLAEVTRYTGGATGGYSAPDTPVRPRESTYEPSKTVRSTDFDPGITVETYVGEEFEDIDWDDFDWDYFDDYADQDEDSYGDEAK